MLLRTDSFRDFDRLAQQVFGTASRPSIVPLDAYRSGDMFVVEMDLPGMSPESIDVTVEHDVLTVKATRIRRNEHTQSLIEERPHGSFERRVFLAEGLDTEHIAASYANGVLRLELPVAEQAKPRRVEVRAGSAPVAIDA